MAGSTATECARGARYQPSWASDPSRSANTATTLVLGFSRALYVWGAVLGRAAAAAAKIALGVVLAIVGIFPALRG